jgi:hypothetical protein
LSSSEPFSQAWSSAPPVPLQTELQDLAAKYATLVVLREARDMGDDQHPSEALRDLSITFPGSLRELDTLGLPELRRRAAATLAAARGAVPEPWMAWIIAFHRLLAAALLIKRAAGSRHGPTIGQVTRDTLMADASQVAGMAVGITMFEAFVHPPGGRLAPLVLREVAARFDVPLDEVVRTLFPSRRPGPRG